MGWSPGARPSGWPTISASAHGRSRCTAPVCWRDSGPTLLPRRSGWPCWRGCRQPILRPTPLIASRVPAPLAGCRNRRSILSRRNARAILPAYSHADNLVSPVVRNENGRSVPAAILREFLGNNNGMRCAVVGGIVGVWVAHLMFELAVMAIIDHGAHGAGQWLAEAVARPSA